MQRMLIVGAGLAGHRAAIELRQRDEDIQVTLLGDEPTLPYDRPPLTKEFMLGDKSLEDITLEKADSYESLDIEFHGETLATEIDRTRKLVHTSGGRTFNYDKLLLATGSRNRRLSIDGDESALHYVRGPESARTIREAMAPGAEIAVIGGGFIGLEVAAAARTRGCEVTVIEASSRILSRGMPEQVSAFVTDLHEKNGVRFLLNTTVTSVERTPSGKTAIDASGRKLSVDLAIAGIGVIPNTELAEHAGLKVENGIVVDAGCRTSDPSIFAAGEVTSHPSGHSGKSKRIESWRTAYMQPAIAVECMLGGTAVFDDPPWLWSDQFDVNIQTIGDPLGGAAQLLHPAPRGDGWSIIAVDDRMHPVGAAAVNLGRDISRLRRLLINGEALPLDMLKNCKPVKTAADAV